VDRIAGLDRRYRYRHYEFDDRTTTAYSPAGTFLEPAPVRRLDGTLMAA